MLALTAPRVHQASAFYYRQARLDAKTLSRAQRVLSAELPAAVPHATELAAALAARKIDARGPRLGLLTIHAELEQVMCSGPSAAGSSPTRSSTIGLRRAARTPAIPAPSSRRVTSQPRAGDAARFRLVVGAHGGARPVVASSRRLPHWSARTLDGFTYWARSWDTPARLPPATFLLPNYDEYLIAYKDRAPRASRPASDRRRQHHARARRLCPPARRGRVRGRTLAPPRVRREGPRWRSSRRVPLTAPQRRAVSAAADRLAAFSGARLTWSGGLKTAPV
jgi:hypothetical protein